MKATELLCCSARGCALGGALLAAVALTVTVGCSQPTTPGGGGGGGEETLKVSFDAEGGNYAVAEDDEGNQYTFRAREEADGTVTITEANIVTEDGYSLKASLDEDGRPVNYRAGDTANADVVYDGDTASIRYVDAEGNVTEGSADAGASRKLPGAKGRVVFQTDPTDRTEGLRDGMEEYYYASDSLFSEELNPDSPLGESEFAEAARRLGEVAQQFDVQEVDRGDLEEVTADEVPALIQQLAGQTFILFDGEGLCVEQTGVENRLTFDLNGVLQNEFDRNVVFPSFGVGETRDSGVTVNYATGTEIDLTPGDDYDFDLTVKPVFTGTGLDDAGSIVIERRFEAVTTFSVDTFIGAADATIVQLFDAALTNGTLSDDGTLLEFDLLLVDLQDDNLVRRVGRMRYVNQNAATPEAIYTCVPVDDLDVDSGIACPGEADLSAPFTVEYIPGRDEDVANLQFDWFVSDGLGVIVSDPFGSAVDVQPTGEGVVEVSVIVHDLSSTTDSVFHIFACPTIVGAIGSEPANEDLFVICPGGANVGEPAYFTAGGDLLAELDAVEWSVIGTSSFGILDRFADATDIAFFEPGRYQVGFSGFDEFGAELIAFCEVVVGSAEYDECELNGWYGDGICDGFCPRPDEDCDDFFDDCAVNGYYGDGICDQYCPQPDPDCEGAFVDVCAEQGYYGDGTCDLWCIYPDPDCGTYDICATNGWYGDGICDFCPQPDPDCEGDFVDVCADNGWYGDGFCDYCPQPDPDCSADDVCAINGWYGDGFCDDCLYPDPDCGGVDICAENGWYGDGFCDFCPTPDPDCEGGFHDVCADNGWYGNGFCDECPFPDPDCGGSGDICADYGWYGDGFCDACLYPDPDCEGGSGDFCADNGWYGDGFCDTCPLPDPDCGATGDFCLDNGLYFNGVCDECPFPDPDCEDDYDYCEEFGYYGDGICDECPEPDPDCVSGDICADNGWYGDGFCDECPQPDPDCG